MDYQVALEICRAYKRCHLDLRKLGQNTEADEMKSRETYWRSQYMHLADKQQSETDVE